MKKILSIILVAALALTLAVCLFACDDSKTDLTNPEYETPAISAAYGQTLGDLALPSGFAWQDPLTTSVGSVGSHTFLVTYTPSDTAKYKTVSDIEVTVTVGKASAAPGTVGTLTATYGQTLADVTLPAGFSWDEEASTKVGDVGNHVFHVTFTPSDTANFEAVRGIAVTVAVIRATYDMSSVSFADAAFTYDGAAKSLQITGTLPEGVTVAYENNGKTDASEYVVTASFTGDEANYNAIEPMTATLKILPATYDMSGVTFANGTFTYDGTAKSLAVTGNLPAGVTVEYGNNGKTAAGVYDVTASFTGNNPNYNKIDSLTAKLTINKATYDMSGVTFENATLGYNGAAQSISVSGKLPDGVTVSYAGNEQTNIGEYEVIARFEGDENNYNAIEELTATLTIAKGTYDLSGVTFDDESFEYDGTQKSITLSGKLPEGVSVQYDGNGQTTIGTYLVTASFTVDLDLYNPIKNMTATMTITKPLIKGLVFADQETVYDGDEKSLELTGLPAGAHAEFSAPLAYTDAGTYEVTATVTLENHEDAVLTATLTIERRQVTIEWTNTTVTYDGLGHFPTGTITDAMPGDEVSVTINGNAAVNAGGDAWSASLELTGADAGNYQLKDNEMATIMINPAMMTLEISQNGTLSYNGQAQSPVLNENITTVDGCDYTVVYRANESDEFSDVIPTFKAIGEYTLYFRATAANHKPVNGSVLITIGKATLTGVSVTQSNTLTYSGGEPLNATVNAVATSADGSDVTFTYKKTFESEYSSGIPVFASAGVYTVDFKATAPNHEDYLGTFTITINKDEGFLYSTGATTDFIYDGNKHMITGLTQVSGPFTFTVNDEPCDGYIEAGSYPITVNVEESDNYLGGTWTLWLYIGTATLTNVSVEQNGVLTYNGAAQSAAVNASATAANAQEVTFTYATDMNGEFSAVVPAFTEVGEYSVYYKATAANHDDKYGEFTVTIEKRTLQISWTNATVTYDGAAHLPTASITNKANESDEVAVALTADGAVNVGGYGWSKTYMTLTGKDADNYKIHAEEQATLTINKAPLTVRADNKEITYGDAAPEFTATITGFVNGEAVGALGGKLAFETTYEAGSNWGNYSITPSGFTSDNYDITFTAGNLRVNRATYDMSGVSFTDKTVTYTGAEQSILITGSLPAGVNVNYTNNTLTNAGNTVATASFTGNANYNAIADMHATLTITKATYDMSGVSFNNVTLTYDGAEHSILITGSLPLGVNVEYTNNTLTTAGSTVASAIFTGDADNYNLIADMNATLTIQKATYDMSGVTFENKTVPYNGNVQTILISGDLPLGVEVEYTNNALTNVGDITATASFTGDADNYYLIDDMYAVLTIVKGDPQIQVSDPSKVYDGTAIDEPTVTRLGDGAITILYRENKNEAEYKSERPIAAGSYYVKVSVAESANCVASFVEQLFGIMGEQEVTITSSLDKAYDEKPVAAPLYTAHGDGEVTIEYKGKLEDDSAYTEEAPINAGDYIVRVTVGRDSNFIYAEGSATKNFTIAKAAKQAAPSFVEMEYGMSYADLELPTGWSYGTDAVPYHGNFTTDYTSDPATYAAELAAGKVGLINNRYLSYTADDNHEGVSENVLIPIYIMKGTRTATVKDDAVTEYLTGITPPDPFIFDYNFVPIFDNVRNYIRKETINELERTVEYKAYGADDNTYTTDAPKTPGDYVMRVTVSATKYMKAAVGTADLTFLAGSVLYTFEKDGDVYHVVGLDANDMSGTFFKCNQTYTIEQIYNNVDDSGKVKYVGYWNTKDVCDMVAYEIREESGTILMELDGDALVPFDFGDPYAIYYAYVERDGEENVIYVGETMLITQKGGEWYLFGLYDQTAKLSIYGFTTRGQFDDVWNSETFSYDTVNNRIYFYEIGLGGEPELLGAYSYDTATNECSEYYGEIQYFYYYDDWGQTLAFCTINGEMNVTVIYDGEYTEQELSSVKCMDYWYGSWVIENSELHYDGDVLVFDVDGSTLIFKSSNPR